MNAPVSDDCSSDGSTGVRCSPVRLGGRHLGVGGTDMGRDERPSTADPRPLRRAGDENSPLEMADLEAQAEEGQSDCSRPYPDSASST